MRLRVGRRQENGRALTEFVMTDTGAGIRPEDQARLFQAFTRADNSVRQEGTGLGLHLSQKLAELLGARISFTSEYGAGSRFTLEWAREDPPMPSLPERT